ncbi:MAG: hypothetical protein ACKOPN_09980 [Prochlorococcaceae cyanobacterium]
MKFNIATTLGLAAIGAAAVSIGSPAQAVCRPGTPDFQGNYCQTFGPGGTNTVKWEVMGSQIGTRSWFQIGFGATDALGNDLVPVPSPLWSVNNVHVTIERISGTGVGTYTYPGTPTNVFAAPLNSPPNKNLWMAFAPVSVSTATGGAFTTFNNSDTITFSYQLPTAANGLDDGDQIIARALLNRNGAVTGELDYDGDHPVLRTTTASPVVGSELSATHVYRVPGPVPLLGAAAAFSASRRLRRRVKAAA